MVYDFGGKVALVTGGANGIGSSIVTELIKNGVKGVGVVDINPNLGEKVVKEFGDKAIFIKTDVTKPDQFEDAFCKVKSKFGGLDIVVNSAGIFNEKQWELTIALNVAAVTRGTLLGMKHMRKDEGGNGGVIVNIASVLGLHFFGSGPVYTGSKHFVVGFDKAMGTDFYYNLTGVKVMSLCPGKTDTVLIDNAMGYDEFKGSHKYAQEQLNNLPGQDPCNVGKGLITLINKGENGSAWVAERNMPAYEAKPSGNIYT